MDEVKQMFEEFKKKYHNTPMFGGYSRLLRKRTEGRQAVLSAFIDSLQMMKVGQTKEVKDYIDTIINDLAAIK
jgi:hypothetical protein